MTKINLLPWREERRRQKTSDFGALAGQVAIATGVLMFVVWLYLGTVTDYHKLRNQYLQGQIDILNTKLQQIRQLEQTKANLLARMNIIQELQRRRPEVVHLFEELVTTVPEGVWLDSIKQAGKTLLIEGNAESNARISAYMRNLESSKWLKNPVLDVIEAGKEDESRVAEFRLRLEQESLLSEDEVE